MFRKAYRSSSEALTVFAASGLHTHVVTGRSQVCVETGTTESYYDARIHEYKITQTTRLQTRPFVRGINNLLKLGVVCASRNQVVAH
jgi:hypothetical protein